MINVKIKVVSGRIKEKGAATLAKHNINRVGIRSSEQKYIYIPQNWRGMELRKELHDKLSIFRV